MNSLLQLNWIKVANVINLLCTRTHNKCCREKSLLHSHIILYNYNNVNVEKR